MILDSFSLIGKRAIVTGTRQGIGQAIAIALAEAGADVVCVGRTHCDKTMERIHTIKRNAYFIKADLARPASAKRIADFASRKLGGIDILVNNAGTTFRSRAEVLPTSEWDRVMNTNCKGPFLLCQAVSKVMLEQGSGKIINIASLMSFTGGISIAAYAASKGGIAQFTKSLSNEWASKGINVNAIAPGYILTEMTEPLKKNKTRDLHIRNRIPAGRWGKPRDLMGAAVFLASKASNYIHGSVLIVDGGWTGR